MPGDLSIPLHTEVSKGWHRLERPFVWMGVTVPAGFVFRCILVFLLPMIQLQWHYSVHDVPRRHADARLYFRLRTTGIVKPLAYLVWLGVRIFGWYYWWSAPAYFLRYRDRWVADELANIVHRHDLQQPAYGDLMRLRDQVLGLTER